MAVTHAQWTGSAGLGVSNKGLKLSVGRPAEKWVNVGMKFKFKRSSHDVSLLSYSQTIEEMPRFSIQYIYFMDHSSILITH